MNSVIPRTLSPMAMGKRKRQAKQASMWVATQDLPRSAAHPFYVRLNQILDEHDFDGVVERRSERFYAEEGRPGLPPGRYFRLLLIGYFEGLDAERAIAWRAADSFALREFLGLVLPEAPPDHSTISRTRRLIDLETHANANGPLGPNLRHDDNCDPRSKDIIQPAEGAAGPRPHES